MTELRLCDVSSYWNFVGMDAVTFEKLTSLFIKLLDYTIYL